MKPHTLEWSTWNETFRKEVASWEQLVSLIELMMTAANPPAIVSVWADSDRELGVGVGRQMTVITYQDSLNPPYFISAGDAREGVEWFCYGREQTEYLCRNLIPSDVLIPTLRAFIDVPGRPSTIEWEQL